MPGEHATKVIQFGKYRGSVVAEVPSSYIRWCLEQDWFEHKYPKMLEYFEDELKWRDDQDQHFKD